MDVPGRQFGAWRTRVGELLRSNQLSEWSEVPPQRVINPLLSFLYSVDKEIKWRAVTAVGIVVARIAEQDLEAARTIMRRLIWSLNDESGGIGWGAAEAMGEIMARQKRLAEEYYRILVSYIREDGNRLENESLETGVLWGIGRLAETRPELLRPFARCLLSYLQSTIPDQRGLAAWAFGALGEILPAEILESLLEDPFEITIYAEGDFHRCRISELAARLIAPRDGS